MAHWAKIDSDNKVIDVTIGNNNDEDEGYQWLVSNFGGTWLKTSYNTLGGVHALGGTPFRGNYAGLGYYYDEALDAFIPPQPYASWVLDQATCQWKAPIAYPTDGLIYLWNEAAVDWELQDFSEGA